MTTHARFIPSNVSGPGKLAIIRFQICWSYPAASAFAVINGPPMSKPVAVYGHRRGDLWLVRYPLDFDDILRFAADRKGAFHC